MVHQEAEVRGERKAEGTALVGLAEEWMVIWFARLGQLGATGVIPRRLVPSPVLMKAEECCFLGCVSQTDGWGWPGPLALEGLVLDGPVVVSKH